MSATLDDALEAPSRVDFYEGMAVAERELRADAEGWAAYAAERDAWLHADLIER